MPLITAVGIVLGILIGSFCANHFSGNRLSIINNSSNKVNDLLHIVDDQYVDSVNVSDLVERALPQILKELDPHSTYTGAKDVDEQMQELRGSFSGIGVQFTIYKDTVRIVRVIPGGPSESAGLQAGDRIVSVDGKAYVGKDVTNDETMKRLKGPAETEVKLGIMRAGGKLRSFTITRGDVPVSTVDAVYCPAPGVGYIRITSFGETTYPEFLGALARLNAQGFENLIIDLRGNLGGYMETAVQIANEFLPKNRLIVYTEGRKSPRKEYRSDGRGTFQTVPLVVLVDESSASASEILAGAVQDNDRGTIIGRRTFGKGLVQVPVEFRDGSMLRLTIARYFTPAGRCVQKPYTPGNEDEYELDLFQRAEHGELFSADSIKTQGEKFHTTIGRTVYGGGGIIPDVFIPRDTSDITPYFRDAYFGGLIYQFAYDYVDRNRAVLSEIDDFDALVKHLNRQPLVENFATFANANGLKRRNLMIRQSKRLLLQHITANIVSDVLDMEASVRYVNLSDPAMVSALDLLEAGKAFPVAPEKHTKGKMRHARVQAAPVRRLHGRAVAGRHVAKPAMARPEVEGGKTQPTVYALCSQKRKKHFANA